MKTAIYIRVSSSTQVDEGESLANQESRCLAEIHHQGWQYYKTYRDEGISAYDRKVQRSGFEDMMRAARAKRFQVLVVYSLSRFGRRVVETLQTIEELSRLKIRILFLDQNIDTSTSLGEFFLTVMAAIAQLESAQLSERIRSVKQYMRSQGRPSGGRPPFGYAHVDGKRIVIPVQAQIIKRIFRDFTANRSTNAIAGDLNAGGIPAQRGGPWLGRNIYRMLRNPVYAGLYSSGDELKQAEHQAIVSADLWQNVQARLNLRSQQDRHARQLLTGFGLLRCAYCGSTCNYNLKRSGDGRRAYGYYSCNARAAGRTCERSRLIRVELLNQGAMNILAQIAGAREVILKELRSHEAFHAKRLGKDETALRSQVDDLNRRYDSLLALAENPNFDVESIQLRAAKLTEQKAQLKLSLAALENTRGRQEKIPLLRAIEKQLIALGKHLRSGDIQRIRPAIPAFFREIRVYRKRAVFELRGFMLGGRSSVEVELPAGYHRILACRAANSAPGRAKRKIP